MRLVNIILKLFLLFIISKNSCFSQVSSFSATPQTAQNCSSCPGIAWSVPTNTPGFLYIVSNNPGVVSKQVYLTNYGFNIPTSATIFGIQSSMATWTCCSEYYYDLMFNWS